MSWYLYKDTVTHRGIKVDGFNYLPRTKISLSWGMNDTKDQNNNQLISNINDPVPLTLRNSPSESEQERNNLKVLTDTSEDEQEELMKLVKSHQEKKIEQEAIDLYNKNRSKSQNNKNIIDSARSGREDKTSQKLEFDRRMRYLQNSLLPTSRRQSMATIFNHDLNKDIPLEQSRMSGKSVLHNKKNESTLPLGDGFNAFVTVEERQMEHLEKLRDQYQYEEKCRQRFERSNIHFG